jgi:hypothetical protein
LPAQVASPAADQTRLDSLLLSHARALLERYGDTFYVLGIYLDSTGELSEIATRAWPALDASPDEWGDSLRAAFEDFRPRLRSAAYLLDRWRQLDSTRADSTFADFHFETAAGACFESRRRYDWAPDGTLIWGPPLQRSCRREIWPGERTGH